MKKFISGLIVGLILATAIPTFAANLTATITSFNFKVNGETRQLSDSPVLIGATTYLPLRATANLLGYDVAYDGASRTISLNGKTVAVLPVEPDEEEPVVEPIVEEPDEPIVIPEPETIKRAGITLKGDTIIELPSEKDISVYGFHVWCNMAEDKIETYHDSFLNVYAPKTIVPRIGFVFDPTEYLYLGFAISEVNEYEFGSSRTTKNSLYASDLAKMSSAENIQKVKERQELIAQKAVQDRAKELVANNNVPLKATQQYLTSNRYGVPHLDYWIKNLTEKTVDAFEIALTCYDTYDRLIVNSETKEKFYFGITQNMTSKDPIFGTTIHGIQPGQTQIVGWTMAQFPNTTRVVYEIVSVHFTDGTVWRR